MLRYNTNCPPAWAILACVRALSDAKRLWRGHGRATERAKRSASGAGTACIWRPGVCAAAVDACPTDTLHPVSAHSQRANTTLPGYPQRARAAVSLRLWLHADAAAAADATAALHVWAIGGDFRAGSRTQPRSAWQALPILDLAARGGG